MADFKNIIVRMPNWIGDAVMAAPLLGSLRGRFPESNITIMCQGFIGELFRHDPSLTEIYNFKKPHSLQEGREVIEELRRKKYDCGLLLTNSFSSAWWFFWGRVGNRIGFEGHFRSFLLSQAVPLSLNREEQHLAETYKELLPTLGIGPSSHIPKLYVTQDEKKTALEFLKKEKLDQKILVGINPGAAYGSAKCWLPERFKKVAENILKDPQKSIILFGDKSQRVLNEEIASGLGERAINLAGKTNIRELMAFISSLSVMLTNDSGPMHIAAALDIPVVALFGSTSDKKTGPLTKNSLVIHKHTECSPCYKRVCPIDFRCMTRIHDEEVFEAINKVIKNE